MDMYDRAAQGTARLITNTYSTSFGLATRLFHPKLRPDIYNIYGLVRLADEIVDTYEGSDRKQLLKDLEAETHVAIKRGYSTNLVVQAYALAARRWGIEPALYEAFFASMRMDLEPAAYDAQQHYETYIHGSAEVVGLMCLRVFCQGDEALYHRLSSGAARLGAAFQKVNFLRDIRDDHDRLGRYYFPLGSYDMFDEATKTQIVQDIEADFAAARPALEQLPLTARPAVAAAYRYYEALLLKLWQTPASQLKQARVRIPNARKLWLLGSTWVRRGSL